MVDRHRGYAFAKEVPLQKSRESQRPASCASMPSERSAGMDWSNRNVEQECSRSRLLGVPTGRCPPYARLASPSEVCGSFRATLYRAGRSLGRRSFLFAAAPSLIIYLLLPAFDRGLRLWQVRALSLPA